MNKNAEVSENKNIRVIAIIIALGIGAVCLFFFIKLIPTSKKSVVQKINSNTETEVLMKKIGALFDLPKGEAPTIATVSDKTKLQKQSFFEKAENGDKVLIYANAKKAILYRPSANKIMEVAPLSIGPTPTVAEKIIPISILNGTKTVGLASTAEKKVVEQFKNIEVVEKGNTVKDYTKTLVVDITGTHSDIVEKIAELFEGTVGQLPQGEKPQKGEIVVIMGK